MAGGINLPNIGVGVGPVMGAMQFQPMAQDPFTTMLKAYAVGQQGRNQGIESLLNAIKAPMIEPSMRAEMNLRNAQADKERMIANVLMEAFGSQDGSGLDYNDTYNAGEASIGAEDSIGVGTPPVSSYTPNVSGVGRKQQMMQLARAVAGFPVELPYEQEQRELRTYQQKENIKHTMDEQRGTTATKSDRQSRELGIASVEPILDEILSLDVPPQFFLNEDKLNPFNLYYGDQQAIYKSSIGLAVDSLMNAYNLPKNIPVINTVKEIVGRSPFESEKGYKERVTKALEHLKLQQEIISSGGKSKPKSHQAKFVRMRGPDGGIYEVAEKDVEAALRSGGSYE